MNSETSARLSRVQERFEISFCEHVDEILGTDTPAPKALAAVREACGREWEDVYRIWLEDSGVL